MKSTDTDSQNRDPYATESSSRVVASRLGESPVPESVRTHGWLLLWAESVGDNFRIATAEPDDRSGVVSGAGSLSGARSVAQGWRVTRAEPSPANLETLRRMLPKLRPAPLGLVTSTGFGDRLGVATPGHVDAMCACGVASSEARIFAQQSMRENSRTGRTAQQVVDDATLGALEEALVNGLPRQSLATTTADLRGRLPNSSVDETPTHTSLAEHYYLAHELNRLDVKWVSLAPLFVGDFEKGVEYIGDLGALALHLQGHATIAHPLGPYKLSLPSGSDKFTAYPIVAPATDGSVHLKTASPRYLEALRVVADTEPELLREITELTVLRFEEDVKAYQISGSPAGMPHLDALPGAAIATLLEQIDARKVLHVTFGSALQAHGESLLRLLRAHPAPYRAASRRHFERHLAPFAATASGGAR